MFIIQIQYDLSGAKPLKDTEEYVVVYAPVLSMKILSPIFSETGKGYGFFSYNISTESQVGPAIIQGSLLS